MQKEVDRNYEAFRKMSFEHEDRHKFALLQDGKLIAVLDTRMDAHIMGEKVCENGLYSVQEIDPVVADLGYITHALCAD